MARKIAAGKLKLSWHEKNGQWRKSIGYKPDKTGTRKVPAEWYFGADEGAALLAAAAKLEEWRVVVDGWDEFREVAEIEYPSMDVSEPFWLRGEGVARDEGDVAAVASTRPENVSVEKAQACYIESLRVRLGLMGPRGLKQSTFNTIVANLGGALGALGDDGRPILPPTKFIHLISSSEIGSVVNWLYRKDPDDEGLSERTALNYARAFQAWLDWMDNQPDLRFRKPKGFDSHFKLGNPQTEVVIPTFAQVAAIYKACQNDFERVCVLLGINCGMYEADISDLTPSAQVLRNGEGCLWWKRVKTSHQNTFYTLHWLFPETVAMLDATKAPENPHGRMLLNAKGLPLSESREKYRTKTISDFFPGVLRRAGLEEKGISFKNLRKFGAHHVRALTVADKNDMARMYLGQAIPGVLRSYVYDVFDPLTAVLRDFREQLLAEAVFRPVDTSGGRVGRRSSASAREGRLGRKAGRR